MELPKGPKKANKTIVKSMVIVSRPKVGKTSALMQLPNSLLIDLEESSEYYDGTAINILEKCREHKIGPITALHRLAKTIHEANEENNGQPVYEYGIIDTITRLEEFCIPFATKLYKNSTVGANFTGKNVVTELEYGAGYGWLRTAFLEAIKPFQSLFKTLIYVGHTKDSSINIKGASVSVSDINLTGKIKDILNSKSDANATLFRNPDKENENILSFINSSTDVITGARPVHLSNKEFNISQYDNESETLITNWNLIFPEILKK